LIKEEKYKQFYMHGWVTCWASTCMTGRYYYDKQSRASNPVVMTVEPGIYISPDTKDIPEKYLGIGCASKMMCCARPTAPGPNQQSAKAAGRNRGLDGQQPVGSKQKAVAETNGGVCVRFVPSAYCLLPSASAPTTPLQSPSSPRGPFNFIGSGDTADYCVAAAAVAFADLRDVVGARAWGPGVRRQKSLCAVVRALGRRSRSPRIEIVRNELVKALVAFVDEIKLDDAV